MTAPKESITEPITHFLTGACIGRAGFNRRTAYATVAAVLAAEAADLDILWGFAGPIEELKHHRGITHTLWAAPVVAVVVTGVLWMVDRWWFQRRRKRRAAEQEAKIVPGERPFIRRELAVRWGWVYAAAFVAALSHLILDWTNNYGVRPFFPFNANWYSGDLVFIVEPVLWGVFALALIVPAFLRLADQEIGVPRTVRRGQGWAIFALAAMVSLWGWRWVEHQRAKSMIEQTQVTREPVRRLALEPYPMNPARWHAILETGSTYQTAEVNTHAGTIESDPQRDVLFKPLETLAVRAAKQTELGKVYMDWGRWAVAQDVGPEPIPGLTPGALDAPQLPPTRRWTTVRFDDLRFQYFWRLGGRTDAPSPLTGWVYILDDREDGGAAIGSRVER